MDQAKIQFSRENRRLIIILMMGVFLSSYTMELYFPFLPFILKSLAIEKTLAIFIMPTYFSGLMFSQLLAGFFTGRFGNKLTFKCALILAALGSFVIAVAPTFGLLLLGFFIQALGAGAVDPICSNLTMESFKQKQAKTVISLTTLAIGAAAFLSPLSVAVFLSYIAMPWFYVCVGGVSLLMIFSTNKGITPQGGGVLRVSFKAYLKNTLYLTKCFGNKELGFFPIIALFLGLFVAVYVALMTSASFILAYQFNRNLEHIGELLSLACLLYLAGIVVSNALVKYCKRIVIMRVSLYLSLINAFSLFLRSTLDVHGVMEINVLLFFLIHFFLIAFTLGMLTPCAYALALSPFASYEKYRASAPPVLRLSINVLTLLLGFIISVLEVKTTLVMSLIVSITLLFATLAFECFKRHMEASESSSF